jgi:hypothetical protein
VTPQGRTEESVLEAFLLEGPARRGLLETYLQRYPDHAEALIELAHEIAHGEAAAGSPAADDEAALIAEAWAQVSVALAPAAVSAADWSRDALKRMQVGFAAPMVLFTSLRDRRVLPDTIPAGVVARLARLLGRQVQAVRAYLEQPAVLSGSMAYKSKAAPVASADKLSFDELLDQAGLSEADRRRLIEEGED